MLRTYKFKLYKNKKLKHIARLINISGMIYNHCIALHKRYYRLFNKSLDKFKLQKHITKLKKLAKYSYWNNLGSQAIQNITERIDEAYKKFFKKQGGLPSFKKVRKYKSFTLKGSVGYKLKDNVFILNKRSYKFSKSREIDGQIKTVTIKRDNIGDFWICISLEVEKINQNNATSYNSVGIDFGLVKFLTLSDNTQIDSPLFHLTNLLKLKQYNKALSSKKKGSNNRKKAKLNLAKLHIDITNKRKDYFYKLANFLADRYNIIYIEDLNMKAMQKLWGRKVSDLAFSKFINILSTKTKIIKINRFYPSSKTCSACGHINENINSTLKSLKDRTFKCINCNFEIDRDLNASINIHRVGASTLSGEVVRATQVA